MRTKSLRVMIIRDYRTDNIEVYICENEHIPRYIKTLATYEKIKTNDYGDPRIVSHIKLANGVVNAFNKAWLNTVEKMFAERELKKINTDSVLTYIKGAKYGA